MPDFNATRTALNASRDRWLAAQGELAAARQETARLEARHAAALRTKAPRRNLRDLEDQLAEARAREAAQREAVSGLKVAAGDRARTFAEFADPRVSISE